MRPRSLTREGASAAPRAPLALDPDPGRRELGARSGRLASLPSAGVSPDAHANPSRDPDAAAAEAELYAAALAGCIALASDPAPRVANLGRAALRTAGCALVLAPLTTGGSQTHPWSLPDASGGRADAFCYP